jgi:hypothetical protein
MRNSHRELANSPSPRSGGQLAELSNPLHLNYPIHRPIGVQFLIRARVYSCRKSRKINVGL